jgi:hypothetical protein
MTVNVSMTSISSSIIQLRTHFRPEGKPAPPRPRKPEALISEMICIRQPYPSILSPDHTHPFVALEQDLLRLMPVAILLRALQVRPVVSIEVLEDAVLVLQASICPLRRSILHCGQSSLLCPALRGGRQASSCRSGGQRSVGGRAERRRGRCVSCEHCDCRVCVVSRD